MERKHLKLSGDYQGEGTHTLLEIGNVKQPYSAGNQPKQQNQRSLGKSKVKHPRLFGEVTVVGYPRLSGDAKSGGKASKL